jgi:hypothetical protein
MTRRPGLASYVTVRPGTHLRTEGSVPWDGAHGQRASFESVVGRGGRALEERRPNGGAVRDRRKSARADASLVVERAST